MWKHIEITDLLDFTYTVSKFEVCKIRFFFFKEMNSFIEQGYFTIGQ